jgi:hypothetical protein
VFLHDKESVTPMEFVRPIVQAKAKAVPLHATKALGSRGDIAPTHSRPRHQMGMSGQPYSPTALYPREKDPRYLL